MICIFIHVIYLFIFLFFTKAFNDKSSVKYTKNDDRIQMLPLVISPHISQGNINKMKFLFNRDFGKKLFLDILVYNPIIKIETSFFLVEKYIQFFSEIFQDIKMFFFSKYGIVFAIKD